MQNGIFILEGNNTYKMSVGINEKPKTSSVFSTYPNPAINQLYVAIANQQGKKIKCMITDLAGQMVLENTIDPNSVLYQSTLNISNLSEGFYFVTLVGNNLKETKKIIIQK